MKTEGSAKEKLGLESASKHALLTTQAEQLVKRRESGGKKDPDYPP
jgi:hypothetical protein